MAMKLAYNEELVVTLSLVVIRRPNYKALEGQDNILHESSES